MSLEMGIGVSSQADVSAAGQEAAEQVMSHLAHRRPDLVLVFSSIRFADPRMLKAVRSVTGQSPLIGCTDAGGIMTSGPRRRSVTVIGFVGQEGAFVTGVERDLSRNPRGGGRTAGRIALCARRTQQAALSVRFSRWSFGQRIAMSCPESISGWAARFSWPAPRRRTTSTFRKPSSSLTMRS